MFVGQHSQVPNELMQHQMIDYPLILNEFS